MREGWWCATRVCCWFGGAGGVVECGWEVVQLKKRTAACSVKITSLYCFVDTLPSLHKATMRFQLPTTILTLLLARSATAATPLAASAPAFTPAALAPAPTSSPPTTPYFLLSGFEAFTPSASHPTLWSRALFNLTLIHPTPTSGWTTLCMAHTTGALCNTTYHACAPVPGAANVNETLSFRFADDLARVDILRAWTYAPPGGDV